MKDRFTAEKKAVPVEEQAWQVFLRAYFSRHFDTVLL